MRRLAAFVSTLAACVVLTASASAAGPPPTLRLIEASPQVSLSQADLRFGGGDLGLWVAATGGNFQLNVTRPGYGAWTTSQVDSATGAPLRAIPAGLVDPASGLRRFLTVRFTNARGHVVQKQLDDFCPSGDNARVDDSGPASPAYSFGCSAGYPYFPWTLGEVWGIASGWAVPPGFGAFGPFGPLPPGAIGPAPDVPRVSGRGPCLPPGIPPALKPGRYTVAASISPVYRQLFAIAADQASVSIRLKVTRSHFPPTCRPFPRRRPAAGAADSSAAPDAAALSVPVVTHPDPATMPNLVALPAWQIHFIRTRRHRELLSFSATIWNAGPATFTIEGYRRPGTNLMDAYEYFSDASGDVVGRAPAGTLFFDSARGHHHWHIAQLAAYDLVEPSGRVVASQKQSFCIAPTDPVDMTIPGVSLGPSLFGGLGFGGSVCAAYDPEAIWLREQLPVGYGDTYTQFVAGQAFDVTNLPNGRYRIEVRVNPLGLLQETNTADDLATRGIVLSGHGRTRKVTALPWHGISG